MSFGPQEGEPSEEEMRAAIEEEMRRMRVEDIVLQSIVSLVNMGARRAGLAPGTEGERDLEQTRIAIDGARALLPVVEPLAPDQAGAIRDAISQLQMAYVQAGGGGAAPAAPEAGEPEGAAPPPPPPAPPASPEGAGDAQRSGRLWIPGQ